MVIFHSYVSLPGRVSPNEYDVANDTTDPWCHQWFFWLKSVCHGRSFSHQRCAMEERPGASRRSSLSLSGVTFAVWWFGTWILFSIYWECHHPNWLIFFRGVGQPPTSLGWREKLLSRKTRTLTNGLSIALMSLPWGVYKFEHQAHGDWR